MKQSGPLSDHVVSIDIQAPVETVWSYITRTGSLQPALYNTVLDCDLTPGSKLRYYSEDRKRVFIVGEVLEIVPPKKFVHTYLFTQRPETPSVVTWELETTPSGCKVTLTHGGWTDQYKTHKGVHAGWKQILGLLKADIETGQLPLTTRIMYKIMSASMFLMPKSTKTEEVDRAGW